MGIIAKIKQIFSKKEKSKEDIILSNWRKKYSDLQKHPLTQAKIINEELLRTIDEVKIDVVNIKERLNNVENKVFDTSTQQIEKIEKVEETIEKVKEKIIVPYAKLSKQEKKIIDIFQKKKKVTANELSEILKISRSNASLKLNKLYSWNFLKKQADGKNIIYWLKTRDKPTKTSKRKSK